MLTITDMTGSIDSPFGKLPFTYDSASKKLKLGDLDPEQAMVLLKSIDIGSDNTMPVMPNISTPKAPDVAAAEPKKRRQRKSRAKDKPEDRETVVVGDSEGDRDRRTNGEHASGSAFAPTEVKMDAEEEAAPKTDGIIVEEVADLSADSEDEDIPPEPDFPVPEGWERSFMDGSWQVTHIACGADPCLCHITAKVAAETAAGAGEAEAGAGEAEAEEEPVQEAVSSSNGATGSEPDNDPIFEALKKCERLVNVIPIMQEHGMTDPQELYDKCIALKPFVPCLTKISANFDERIKRAITVRTP